MGKTLLLILLLIVGFSSGQEPIDGSTLNEKGGLCYAPNSTKPYSGDVVWYYKDGQKMEEGTYKNGEKVGTWTGYTAGRDVFRYTPKTGEIAGTWTGYTEGRDVFHYTPIPGMVYVEGGTFQMGSNRGYSDENPIHTVTVNGFFMDKMEVTQAEYRRVMGNTPSNYDGCDDCAVEEVSWHDANAYAKKVGKRLPTEAEWEYAARGGNKSKGYTYSGSNNLDAVGWYDRNSNKKTNPVGHKQPNELGLYDMSGDVFEWCSDWYGDYSSSQQTDPQGSNSGESRVLRGGSWGNDAVNCRITYRCRFNLDGPVYGFNSFGLRLVMPAKPHQ